MVPIYNLGHIVIISYWNYLHGAAAAAAQSASPFLRHRKDPCVNKCTSQNTDKKFNVGANNENVLLIIG